jgi:hypothetical protein
VLIQYTQGADARELISGWNDFANLIVDLGPDRTLPRPSSDDLSELLQAYRDDVGKLYDASKRVGKDVSKVLEAAMKLPAGPENDQRVKKATVLVQRIMNDVLAKLPPLDSGKLAGLGIGQPAGVFSPPPSVPPAPEAEPAAEEPAAEPKEEMEEEPAKEEPAPEPAKEARSTAAKPAAAKPAAAKPAAAKPAAAKPAAAKPTAAKPAEAKPTAAKPAEAAAADKAASPPVQK